MGTLLRVVSGSDPVNMPDHIRKRFGYGQRAAGIGPDRICRIRLSASVSVPSFQRRPGSCCTKPARIRLEGLVRFWPTASGPEASRCARIIWPGSGRTQPARNQFPTFRLGPAFFHRRFGPFTQDQAGSDLVLADCVRFWPNGSGPEASCCARTIGPPSGQRFRPDLDRVRNGSGMFTRDP